MIHLDLLKDGTFWVGISFIIFILLVFKPLSKIFDTSLKKKINELKQKIDESKKLYEDAETLHKEYLNKQKENIKRIERIKSETLIEVKHIKQKFENDIEETHKRKQKNYDQIAIQIEHKVSEEIKKEILENAIFYTEKRIKKNLSKNQNKSLVEDSLKKLSNESFS